MEEETKDTGDKGGREDGGKEERGKGGMEEGD